MRKVVSFICCFLFLVCILTITTTTRFNVSAYYEDSYVVKTGDTLWDIGSRFCHKNDDIRRWIFEVQERNGMDLLKAGQVIRILKLK